jgi:hypothetical protein
VVRLYRLVMIVSLALAAWPPAAAQADHLVAIPYVDGVLEKTKDGAWNINVSWRIDCAESQRFEYAIDLIREDTGEAIFVTGDGYGTDAAGTDIAGAYPSHDLPAGTAVHLRMIARCFADVGGITHTSERAQTVSSTILIPDREGGGGGGGGGSGGGGGGGSGSDPNSPPLPPRCPLALLGTSASEKLTGTADDDRIFGFGGEDRIHGLDGDDCLVGGRGDDRLAGDAGADLLFGGTDDDVLNGGRGPDSYRGGPGKDVLRADDGKREAVICGSGRDTARVDRHDRTKSCEKVVR